MRLPSLHRIAADARRVFFRFPLEMLIAVISTGAAMLLIDESHRTTEDALIRAVLTCLLGLPAALACTLYGERRGLSRGARLGIGAALVALLVAYNFSLHSLHHQVHAYRFAGLLLAVHAAVAVAGFPGRGRSGGFWDFNKTLFLRICTAAIFSGVLFGGLAGALAAVDALFAVKVDEEVYAQLFCLIAGIFNTVFFLSGVPQPQAAAGETAVPYPRVLRLFIQFVLVPLVTLYLLILLAYEAKIIVQWRLPKGWVSNLVLAYGVAGILTILLAHPIRHADDNRWVRLFSQWFYALLLPLVALMLVAIGQRIGAYGFTEERYFVLALGLWLAGVAIYFLARRDRADIRVIPASLMVLGVLAVLGPLSAPAVSVYSQRGRLRTLLAKNGMLQNGQAVPAKDSVSFNDRKGISSAIEYLIEHRGMAGLRPIIPNADTMKDERYSHYDNVRSITTRLNLTYVSPWQTSENEPGYTGTYIAYKRSARELLDIRGYDYCLPLQAYYGEENDTPATPRYRVAQVTTQRDSAYDQLHLAILNEAGQTIAGPVSADSFFEALLRQYPDRGLSQRTLPNAAMTLTGTGQGVEYRMIFDRLEGDRGQYRQGSAINYGGLVLIREVR